MIIIILYSISTIITPQDGQKRLVLQVYLYLSSNTLEVSVPVGRNFVSRL